MPFLFALMRILVISSGRFHSALLNDVVFRFSKILIRRLGLSQNEGKNLVRMVPKFPDDKDQIRFIECIVVVVIVIAEATIIVIQQS